MILWRQNIMFRTKNMQYSFMISLLFILQLRIAHPSSHVLVISFCSFSGDQFQFFFLNQDLRWCSDFWLIFLCCCCCYCCGQILKKEKSPLLAQKEAKWWSNLQSFSSPIFKRKIYPNEFHHKSLISFANKRVFLNI